MSAEPAQTGCKVSKQRMRRAAKYALAALVILLIGLWLSCPKLKILGKVLVLGLTHHHVDQSTRDLPPVNRIEINLLQDAAAGPRATSPDDYSRKPGPGLFPIPPYGRWDKILSTAVAAGKDAEELAYLWRHQHFSEGFSSLCHYPAYGLRFYDDANLLFETSVCWQCGNFVVKWAGFWGFDSQSRMATNLLMELQKHLPLPPKAEANPEKPPE